ncbi:hypothetical protein VTO58DRAFT_103981 [Aureobasidium pullulans]
MCGRRGITTLGPSAQSSTGSKVSNLDYIARWATTLWNLLSELAGFNTAASSATKNDHPCPVTNFTSLSHEAGDARWYLDSRADVNVISSLSSSSQKTHASERIGSKASP